MEQGVAVGAALVVDFLEVGEVVPVAVEVVQEGDILGVGVEAAAEAFEGANREAEVDAEDEVLDIVDHSTENYNTYTCLHIFIAVQRPIDCSVVEVARSLSARSF